MKKLLLITPIILLTPFDLSASAPAHQTTWDKAVAWVKKQEQYLENNHIFTLTITNNSHAKLAPVEVPSPTRIQPITASYKILNTTQSTGNANLDEILAAHKTKKAAEAAQEQEWQNKLENIAKRATGQHVPTYKQHLRTEKINACGTSTDSFTDKLAVFKAKQKVEAQDNSTSNLSRRLNSALKNLDPLRKG